MLPLIYCVVTADRQLELNEGALGKPTGTTVYVCPTRHRKPAFSVEVSNSRMCSSRLPRRQWPILPIADEYRGSFFWAAVW